MRAWSAGCSATLARAGIYRTNGSPLRSRGSTMLRAISRRWPIGHLAGFEFRVDPTARLADKRLLLAAAERRLGEELDRRAAKLCEAPDSDFRLVDDGQNGPSPNGPGFGRGGLAIGWEGHILA